MTFTIPLHTQVTTHKLTTHLMPILVNIKHGANMHRTSSQTIPYPENKSKFKGMKTFTAYGVIPDVSLRLVFMYNYRNGFTSNKNK